MVKMNQDLSNNIKYYSSCFEWCPMSTSLGKKKDLKIYFFF